MRTPFQRDRDRIVHATAFRRLTYKTQVFLYHEGDHFRTRLTHSLEVAQIARALARQLGLDEDLAEALALAHDLGHPPFGHAGERALDRVMSGFGGFDHNAQSLRVVCQLERKYARFDGLNLTFETLEGLAKHNGPVARPATGDDKPDAVLAVLDGLGLADALSLARHAPAEAQVAAIADDIAYTTHDIDDALRAGLLRLDDLATAPMVGPFVGEALAAVSERAGDASSQARRASYEVSRRMITAMIADVLAESRDRLAELAPASADDVRDAGRPMIAFSETRRAGLVDLRAYLFRHVYRHERVMRVMRGAEAIVSDLFAAYFNDAATLPGERGTSLAGFDAATRARRIADFIAGMTDRFAIGEHARLFDASPELR